MKVSNFQAGQCIIPYVACNVSRIKRRIRVEWATKQAIIQISSNKCILSLEPHIARKTL